MADNFEKLGFEVNVTDKASPVLDNIIKRLERIQLSSGVGDPKEEKQIIKNTKSLGSYITKLTSVVVLAKKIANFTSKAIQESANYVENLNLFAVAYGETYKQQLDWALGISKAYGLANNEVLKFAGTFRELSTSLGLVSDTADLVSQTVTNLGYDLSALFNTTVEQAMEKLQSGIFSGNVRPLRAYGIDISQNQIDALFETNEALKQLGVNSKNLSQSDKVLARLIITLQSGKDSFGTMAREINNLQSQFRIFQGSLANFKLAIGDLVNKPLVQAMFYINGFIIAMTNVIRAFVPLTTEDETPKALTNTTLGAEEASEALDNLQGKLAGFDKFNVLQQGNETTSSLAVTEALNMLLEEQSALYQSQLGDLTEIGNKATEIAKTIEKSINDFIKPLQPYIEFIYNTIKNVFDVVLPLVEDILVGLSPILEPITKIVGDILKLVENIIVLVSPILGIVIDLLNPSTQILEIIHAITWVLSTVLSGVLYGIFGILTPIVFAFETILKVVESIAAVVMSLFQWDWSSLGKNLSNIWSNWRVGELTNALANFSAAPKFANGGYTNANLIMTHENGKREWVGKAAGSNAIVNDTQMSDIMEGAVTKGVYNALRANNAMSGNISANETIVVKIGEEAVFNAVRKTAKKQGVDFANV